MISLRSCSSAAQRIGIAVAIGLASAAGAGSGQMPPVSDPALRLFLEQVDREWPGESEQQAITVKSLELLADAIGSVARRKQLPLPDLESSVRELRELTERYRAGRPDDLVQARRLRDTFVSAADLIDRLLTSAGLQKKPVDPRLGALHRSAESLDAALTVRRQPDVLERFFTHAGEALRRIETADLARRWGAGTGPLAGVRPPTAPGNPADPQNRAASERSLQRAG